jgi:hypothetical protein
VLSCEGHWKVTAVCEGVQREITAVMLFICDGSTSYLGKVMIMMTMMMMVMTIMIDGNDDDDDYGGDNDDPKNTWMIDRLWPSC